MFVLILFLLSLPFWLLGMIIPGPILPYYLPISAFMFICPLITAIILTWQCEKSQGIRELFLKTFHFQKKSLPWLIISMITMPMISILSYFILKTLGMALTISAISLIQIVLTILVYFICALSEEIGWTNYLTNRLQKRFSPLKTGLMIGVLWATWHVIPYYFQGHNIKWIIAQCVATIAMRVIMTYIYNRSSQSVLCSIIFHSMINVSFSLFPNQGSGYDPVSTAFLTTLLALLIVGLDRKLELKPT